MQRWTGYLFAALFVGSIVLVIVQTGGSTKSSVTTADAGADVAAEADVGSTIEEDGGGAPRGAGGGEPQIAENADAGGTLLLSGQAPPPLAAEAPKSVVFGVILVQYRGSQGAPPNARSREAALELAKQLAQEAKQDFKAAVAKGDKGSMENAGRLPRGILEPAPEYVLFSLPKGEVSDPVDTPRGFWIVRRIE